MFHNTVLIIVLIGYGICAIGLVLLFWYVITMPLRLNKLMAKAQNATKVKEFVDVWWELVELQNSNFSRKILDKCRDIQWISVKRSIDLGLYDEVKKIVEK